LSDGRTDAVSLRIMALLLIVAAVSVFTLWTLSPTATTSQSVFGIYLAVDLACFAMISYIYRGAKTGDGVGRAPLIAGCLFVLLLVAAGFAA